MGFLKLANAIWLNGIKTKKSDIVPWGTEVEAQLAALANGGFILPDRLGDNAELITDWDDAVASGWFRGNNAANSPDAGWFIGVIISHAASWVTQDVWAFSSDNETTEKRWRRDCNNGTWGSWFRVFSTGPEILALVNANISGGGAAPVVRVFTASGTYTPTAGAVAAHVHVTGAGAGGGNSNAASNSGGAGGTAIKMIDLAGITSAAITIGAGDTGNGTDSIYSDGTNTLTGFGGSTGGLGGAASGGDLNISGGGGAKSDASWDTGITGGASIWGAGGPAGGTVDGAFGGGGAVGKNNATGGDGGHGVVYIVEYF